MRGVLKLAVLPCLLWSAMAAGNIVGNAVVIENPSFDMTGCGPVSASNPNGPQICKSQFFESLAATPGASQKIQAVYLDIGSIDFDFTQPYSATCATPPAIFNVFAPGYSNVATGESDPCQDLSTLIRSYAQYGAQTYVWVSSASLTDKSNPNLHYYSLEDTHGQLQGGLGTTDIGHLESAIESVLTSYAPDNTENNPVLSGIVFENTGIFQNVADSGLTTTASNFYANIIATATQNQQTILIYEPPNTMTQDFSFVHLIPLYDLSDSTPTTGWTTNPNNPVSSYSPEILADYSNSVAAQINGHAVAYGAVPYQYMLPASGQDSIWTVLQGYGTAAPDARAEAKDSAVPPASVEQTLETQDYQYQDVSSCPALPGNASCNAYIYAPLNQSQSASSINLANQPQVQYLQAAMSLITPAVANDQHYQGTVLYNVRPPYFWLGLAAKTKTGCLNPPPPAYAPASCFGTLPDSIEPNEVALL